MRVQKPTYPLHMIIMDVLDKAVTVTEKTDVKALADDVAQKLKDKIKSNDFNFNIDHESDYNKRKDASSSEGAGIPLIDTGEYVRSIEVRETPTGYTIGVRDDLHPQKRPSNSEPLHMRDLAEILEFGYTKYNVNSPPFPHWRPALANLRRRKAALSQELKKKVAKRAQQALDEYLSQPRNKEVRHL